MDKSVHMAYLSKLALEGFVVASVQYRTSNEASYPSQIQDVKAGIRYLKAHSERYHIDIERIGIMGDSAGGYLTAMAAFDNDKSLDVGAYLDCSSEVKAACMWYPPTNLAKLMNANPVSAEKLMLGAELSNKKSDVLLPSAWLTSINGSLISPFPHEDISRHISSSEKLLKSGLYILVFPGMLTCFSQRTCASA
mgnify:FL=1